ncbi:MAG: hypothetical protein WBG70_19545 [Spirulinaceae cyanobacterium]
MAIWLLTIGNSDVQLKRNVKWKDWQRDFKKGLNNCNFTPVDNELANKTKTSLVPSRALGYVYTQELEEKPDKKVDRYASLVFPLLNNFCSCLKANKDGKQNIELSQIVIFVTDQSQVFASNQLSKFNCPYWQDTCELEPIISKYLNEAFPNVRQKFIRLCSKSSQEGLENWNSTLNLVKEELSALLPELNRNSEETIYVSHQASTPAISSAVQFMSLTTFGDRIRFLVSNEYNDQPGEVIASSTYLRGIKVQQATSLIKAGSPGGAMQLLEDIEDIKKDDRDELDELVGFFNIESSGDSKTDFEVDITIARIINALDLIEKFFEQENYIQGITLLAAAQEAFVKAAIVNKLEKLSTISGQTQGKVYRFKPRRLFKWFEGGLWFDERYLIRELNLSKDEVQLAKQAIMAKLGFTLSKYTGQNWQLLPWLQNLASTFKPWDLLEWTGKYKRDFDSDKRNQIMHNLRGVEKKDVVKYLLGKENNEDVAEYLQSRDKDKAEHLLSKDECEEITKGITKQDIYEVYQEKVKQPFIEAIQDLKLPYKKTNLQNRLNKLAERLAIQ